MNCEMVASHIAARKSESARVSKKPHLKALELWDSYLKQSHAFCICSAKIEAIFLSVHIEAEII